ncbi:MAG: response regulator transcription factor [Burkholderiales bacterium]|jgi:DNA-binding NarL/FixJ family response regulator|nr:response regulator transcription factor [Burkholderiales bacterium]
MSEPAMQILLVEDQSDAVDLLQELVRTVFPTAQVKVCGTVAHALMQLDLPWQLALVDLRLLDGSGLVVLQALKAAQPDTQAIVTTLYHDDDIVFSALQAGADGYLLKSDPLPSLVSSLRRMADGEPPLSAAVARRILKHCRSGQVQPVAATPLQAAVLTPRETQVLAAIGEGLSIAEVGERLGMAYHTTNDHIKAIYRKLGIRTRAQAATEAMRRGLLEPPPQI